MDAANYTTVNLGLPAVPESSDPKLFPELVRIYNAIKLLASSVDTYTKDGTLSTDLTQVQNDLESLIDTHSRLAQLRKQYYRYTVPIFTVVGAFGCNGKPPHTAIAITNASGNSPAGGVGTAAGGFDTAAHRDSAIAAINANAAAITEIQNILKQFGLAS